jgi:D-beta-D-heptose 7-phosphate kinase/D-beta-D-heptose 1-phosphate adenosyltransferase
MAKNVYNNLLAIVRSESKNHSVYHLLSRNEAIKTRYVDTKTNHYFIRVDEHDDKYEQIEFEPELEYTIKSADCIVISDYGKGFLTEDDIFWIAEIKKKTALIFLDTKKKFSEKLALSADFIKINYREFLENFKGYDYADYTEKIVVTLGEKGAMHDSIVYPVTSPQNTIDVSGAGDTFLAALAFNYMHNKDIKMAIDYANDLSSKVVLKKGVNTI